MKLTSSAKSACGCAGCDKTFSNLTLFDRHQHWDYDAVPRLSCKTPESLGLVSDQNGTWWTPEGLKSSTERVAAMKEAR